MIDLNRHNPSNGLAPYLTIFGLHTEPFSNDIQDDFFLLDPQRSQRLNMLYHLAKNSELLLVVTGENGSGKTSLLQHFIDMSDDSLRSCVIDANTMMNPEQLLIQIAEGFGLPQDSVNFGSGLEMLKKRLVDMKRSELSCMLVIDDAHELPAASLTMLMKLSELSDDNEGLLRIILFSEPQLVEILNASALKDVRYRVIHTLEMPVLNEQATTNYIEHRLSVAGLKHPSVFSKNQLKRIYRLSGGIPGKINLYAHEALLDNYSHLTVKPVPNRLYSVFIVLLVFSLIGSVGWFFGNDAINKISGTLFGPDNITTHDAITNAQKSNTPLPLMPAKPLISSSTTGTDKTSVSNGIPAATISIPSDSSVTSIDHLANMEISTSADTSVDIKTETATKETVSIETASEVSVSVAEKPVALNWFERQDPKYFTLQILGSHDRLSITRIMHAHKLSSDKAEVLHTRLNNKDWFILVYGSYSTREKARGAILTLPKDLQLTKPWPRQIGAINPVN